MFSARADFLFCMSVLLLRNAALRKTKIFEGLEIQENGLLEKKKTCVVFPSSRRDGSVY